ncbi:aldehyde dehydrogenase family protein, partial [Phocaeicola vulgatus]
SRNRANLERAREEFHVGNLYFNRKCTGALVGVHPFGGFNMSGTDSKAGGPDYLLLFTQAKLVSEKL